MVWKAGTVEGGVHANTNQDGSSEQDEVAKDLEDGDKNSPHKTNHIRRLPTSSNVIQALGLSNQGVNMMTQT